MFSVKNRRWRVFFLFGLFTILISTALQAQVLKFPQPEDAVTDFAEVIPPDYEARMNQLAQDLLKKTGTAVVVATFRDLGGDSPEAFATKLYEAWGIGEKGEDKGVLILVALEERQIRIETGYGAEGILPDAKVGSIMDQYMIPFLRRGEYGEGLLNGMAAVAQVIAQNADVDLDLDRYAPGLAVQSKAKWGIRIFPLLLFLFIIFGFLGRIMGFSSFFFLPWIFMGGGGRGMSGGFGGFGGGFGGFGGGMSGGGGASRGF